MEQWEKNYYISSIAGAANGSSLVIMSKGWLVNCSSRIYIYEASTLLKRRCARDQHMLCVPNTCWIHALAQHLTIFLKQHKLWTQMSISWTHMKPKGLARV